VVGNRNRPRGLVKFQKILFNAELEEIRVRREILRTVRTVAPQEHLERFIIDFVQLIGPDVVKVGLFQLLKRAPGSQAQISARCTVQEVCLNDVLLSDLTFCVQPG
jgi:hypothetical protein